MILLHVRPDRCRHGDHGGAEAHGGQSKTHAQNAQKFYRIHLISPSKKTLSPATKSARSVPKNFNILTNDEFPTMIPLAFK
jgi:hypothetical protein